MLQFADGSWWDFLTHDMDVQAFAGTDVDRVHFDEEPPGGKGYLQYDESLTRLIDRDGDVRFTLTPLEGMSWVFYELTSNDVPSKDDEVYVVEGSMEDNPTLSASSRTG
jgi:phage terminase large subunit-like protein